MKSSEDNLTNKKNKWIYFVFIITFTISILFGSVSNALVNKLNIFVACIILILIIGIGIAFDMIGMSVVGCNEASFHSKAAKKQKGAKEAVKLVRYADKVSSVCNDVIGDVCGVISGAVSAMLAIKVASMLSFNSAVVSLIFGAVVASLTVGGKAIEKSIIIKHSDRVIYMVGKILYYVNPKNYNIKKKKTKK